MSCGRLEEIPGNCITMILLNRSYCCCLFMTESACDDTQISIGLNGCDLNAWFISQSRPFENPAWITIRQHFSMSFSTSYFHSLSLNVIRVAPNEGNRSPGRLKAIT